MLKNRPPVLEGKTYKAVTHCGPMYIILNTQDGKLEEIFLNMGKSGGCARAWCECVGRVLTICRNDTDIRKVVRSISAIGCSGGAEAQMSCPSVIAKTLEQWMADNKTKEEVVP
jgi:ribonucleoside-diphosphate reductase alpha chain